jgi:hypothetical protein
MNGCSLTDATIQSDDDSSLILVGTPEQTNRLTSPGVDEDILFEGWLTMIDDKFLDFDLYCTCVTFNRNCTLSGRVDSGTGSPEGYFSLPGFVEIDIKVKGGDWCEDEPGGV